MTDLSGKDYIARRRLSDADDTTLAEVGDTCERVPVASLEPLLASGHIELVREAVILEPSDSGTLEDVMGTHGPNSEAP